MKVKLWDYAFHTPDSTHEADFVEIQVGGKTYRISEAGKGNPEAIAVSNTSLGIILVKPMASNLIEVVIP